MKKLFFIVAITGAALVSCTKNELAPSATEQHEITFASPVVGVQTKAFGAIGTTYNTSENFEVWSVYNTEDISEWGGTTYFSDVTAQYNTDADGWGLNPKYFWPANGKLSFVALSPAMINTTTYTADNGFTIQSWSQGASEEAIVDLMYSEPTFNQKRADFANDDNDDDNDDIANGEHKYNGVDIKFKHALSYLVFNIKTKENYAPQTQFQLESITLSGIYTTGTFTQKGIPAEGETWDPWAESTTNTGTYAAYNEVEATERLAFTSTAVAVPETTGKEIILLPQALTADQQKITIKYDIRTNFMEDDEWITQTQTVDLTNTTVTEWEMGKKYTYTITIGMDEILFDPAVTDWDSEDGGEIAL